MELAGWVIAMAAVLVIADRAIRFWKDHLREQPSPSATYVTRTSCVEQQSAQTKRTDDLRQEMRDLVTRNQTDVDEVKEILGRVHERLDEMETRIGNLPDRVVALLTNARQLMGKERP